MTDNPTPRQFFRIPYPEFERPVLLAAGQSLTVLELSEGGLKLADCPAELVSPGGAIDGTLKLLSGGTPAISATHLRTTGNISIFNELSGLSYADMLAEQRYLIRKYGRKILANP